MAKITLPFILSEAIREDTSQAALVTAIETVTYDAFADRVKTMAHLLEETGIRSGERIAISADAGIPYLCLFTALLLRGVTIVPLNPAIPTPAVVRYMNTAGVRHVFTDRVMHIKDRNVSVMPIQNFPDDGLKKKGSHTQPRKAAIQADRPATVVFTSGSSAEPKAALHSYGNHYYSALGSNQNITLRPGDRWLLSLPLYHVSGIGILFRCALASATIALPGSQSDLIDNIKTMKPTHISLVAAQLRQLLDEPAIAPVMADMKAILLGGSPIPADLIDHAYDANWPILTSYGSTEMSSQITTTPPDADRAQLHTSGKPLPFRQVKIAEDGEIMVRGKTLFLGYTEEDAVRAPVDEEGWLGTGDTGMWDHFGNLIVTGRKDRMFMSGGENIIPEEIEQALEQITGIERAVVVPVADERYGFRPVAFVKPHGGFGLNDTEVRKKLRDMLPGYKIPDAFYDWPQAQEEGIKPDYRVLKKRAAEYRRSGIDKEK